MIMTRLFTAAAAVALMSGAALAQSAPAAPVAAIAPVAGPVVANGDLIQTAKASGQFTTLLKALDATNLTSVLKTNPNLTLFAPTDAAFAALPAGELDRLMKPENAATLQKVLTYHLINTKVDSSQIAGGKVEVKTVEGLSVALDGSGDTPMVDGAKIVQADVMATNGVLHVVDKVLLPSDVLGLQASAATDATVAVNVAADAAATETAGVIPMSSQSPEAQATLKAGDLNVVSNPPVADTPENRAKFGKPISNAGKSTPPKGN
ncbi:MAG: fasciclin domain-containing protein [bacterium]|nr:fasciclin domain-containing protein [bacterium]